MFLDSAHYCTTTASSILKKIKSLKPYTSAKTLLYVTYFDREKRILSNSSRGEILKYTSLQLLLLFKYCSVHACVGKIQLNYKMQSTIVEKNEADF